jgi:hypothetical protein
MSVTSVQPDRPTPYRPVSGNNSQRAKFAGPAKLSQGDAAIRADSAILSDRQGTVEAGYSDPAATDAGQSQDALAQARRADGATAAGSTSEASESQQSQSSAGIALYKRVSQIGSAEPSASELLKSWNSIMQGGQDADDAGSATLKALLQSGAPTSGSGILDVTA